MIPTGEEFLVGSDAKRFHSGEGKRKADGHPFYIGSQRPRYGDPPERVLEREDEDHDEGPSPRPRASPTHHTRSMRTPKSESGR